MTSLSLVDSFTGEVYDVDAPTLIQSANLFPLAEADTTALAQFIDSATELRRVASEAAGQVSDELVARMDANARWTMRLDRWEIKAPSPAAGTVSYDIDLLREALDTLVTVGTITRAGAWAALEPVRATVEVSYRLLRDALRALDGYETADCVFGELEEILLGEPEPTYRLKLAGVNALLKIPAARESIEACQIATEPPRRVARVKRS